MILNFKTFQIRTVSKQQVELLRVAVHDVSKKKKKKVSVSIFLKFI